jgi:hypothetical protein
VAGDQPLSDLCGAGRWTPLFQPKVSVRYLTRRSRLNV